MRKIPTQIIIGFFCLIQLISTPNCHAQNCWSPLGIGASIRTSPDSGYVVAMCDYQGSLIAGGYFDSAGGINVSHIAAWNGTTWSSLGSGLKIANATEFPIVAGVYSMVEYNGDLYVAGIFDTAGGVRVHNIAKWDGTAWSEVGAGSWIFTVFSSLAVYNGDLYAAGIFDTVGNGGVSGIAKWDGTSWSNVANISTNHPMLVSSVEHLTVSNGILYAGGYFDSISGVPALNIASWNDTSWSALGAGIGFDTMAPYGGVWNMVSYQGGLYAEYDIQLAIGDTALFNVYKWNGNSWINIGDSTNGNGFISSFFVFDSLLIAGGYFDTIGGVACRNLAQWNGSSWSEFGSGCSGDPISINSYNGALYAGGTFTEIGNVTAMNIAQYTCGTDGIREINTLKAQVYPNPSSGQVRISLGNFQSGMSIQIYDPMGREVLVSTLTELNSVIELTGKPAGVYCYHISSQNGGSSLAGHFVLE